MARIRLRLAWMILWLLVPLVPIGGCAPPANDPCPPGTLSMECRQRCQNDGECIAPAICDKVTRRCLIRPIACDPTPQETPDAGAEGGEEPDGGQVDGGTSQKCPQDKECDFLTRTCIPRPGASCRANNDCRPGEVCQETRCTPDPNSKTCDRDAECPPTQVCRLTVGQESSLRGVCGPPIGPSDAGSRCASGAECQSGICLLSGVCYGACTEATAAKDCHSHEGVICGQVVFSVGTTVAAVRSCTLKPTPCKQDRDCEAQGGVCRLGADPSDPKKLITLCGPARGSARSGGSCVRDTDCATGFCLSTYCFSTCATAAQCRSGFACRPKDYVLGDISATANTCVPAKPCTSKANCPAPDETCSAQPNAAETGLELVCTPGIGRETGEACMSSTECKSGLCILPGICAGGCGVDADCPKGPMNKTELCRPVDLTRSGISGTVKSCQVPPDSCERDADCTRPGEICRAFRSLVDPTRIATGCGAAPNPTKAGPGQTCSLSTDCKGGYCMSFTQPPVCYGPCKTDGDCPAGRRCYQGYASYITSGMAGQTSATYDATSACAPDIGSRQTCLGNGRATDCPVGEVCIALPDAQQVAWLKRCQKPIGTKKGGETCTDTKECQSGRCQLVGASKRCIGLCGTAMGDPVVCAAGTTCKSSNLDLRIGRTAALTYCQ